MNFKHTPGPWEFMFEQTPESVKELEVLSENSCDGKGWKFKQIDIGNNGRSFVKVSAGTIDIYIQSYDEFDANAKLIVAAPDLLAACVNVMEWLANDKDRQYERDVLLAAIKKATH